MAVTIYNSRKDIPEEFTWNLKDIFADDEAFSAEYEALKALPEKLSAYKNRLADNADTLLEYLKLYDEADVRLSSVYGYANCKSDEDTANNKYIDMKGKAVGIYVAVSAACAFDAPEIIEIGDEKLQQFFDECPALNEYKRKIDFIRRNASHTLSKECEALLANAGEIREGPENINSCFMNADITFPDVSDSDKNAHSLTDGTLVHLLESSDRVLRKNTFETYYKRIDEFKNTIASTLNAHFKQQMFFSSSRNFGSMLEAALFSHEVPVGVYHSLIETVHANIDKMHAYVSLRKKLLGTDELHMYDIYTPVVSDTTEEITFEEAKSTVIDALSVLGDDYIALLKKGFDNRWIDVYENKGKRSGAYSSGISRPHPYVLLNHKDNLDSLFTLAHEMGHSLHSYYSTANQPVSTSDYVIFVAEVASTCNEVLVMKYLLNKTKDKNKKIYLINHFLDQFKGTIFRQTMFAEFELFMAKMCENGESLTAATLSEEYIKLNKLYYGNDMISDDEIALEWARIPHFFYNFYVFQYATGFSAAVAIANRILSEGQNAVDDYKKFLSSGSSKDPISLLKIAGVDMNTPAPVDSALKLFGELLEELRKLTEE